MARSELKTLGMLVGQMKTASMFNLREIGEQAAYNLVFVLNDFERRLAALEEKSNES